MHTQQHTHCISVCVVIRCSISVSECGPSVSTCRNSLPRWSHTDLTLADKLYLAKSSTMFAVILPPQIQKLSDTWHLLLASFRELWSVWPPTFSFAMFHFPHLESCTFVPCRLKVVVIVYTCTFTMGSWWPCVSEAQSFWQKANWFDRKQAVWVFCLIY